jgi:hypothetical protein
MHRYIESHNHAKALVKTLDYFGCRSWMICGGFARDSIMGGGISDVDIRVELPGHQSTAVYAARIATALNAYWSRRPRTLITAERRGDEEYTGPFEVYRLAMSPEHHIDLMLQETPVVPHEVFQSFDFGICEAGITERGVITSDRFEAALADGHDRARPAADQAAHAIQIEHRDRIAAKYPHLILVVPPIAAEVVNLEADFDEVMEPQPELVRVPAEFL